MTFNGVPAGETRSFSQTVTMPECTSGSNVPFTVSASAHTADCGDSQPISGTCQVLCRKPEVKIEKTGPTSVTPGTTFTYTLKVTNIGDVPLERIHVTDDICPQAAYQDNATPTPTSEPILGTLDGQVVWDVPGDWSRTEVRLATCCYLLGTFGFLFTPPVRVLRRAADSPAEAGPSTTI